MSPDLKEFTDALTGHLKTISDQFLEGAKADRDRFASQMAADMTSAALMGDQETMDEIMEQAKSLAEKHRVAVSDSLWSLFISSARTVPTLISIALRLAGGVA